MAYRKFQHVPLYLEWAPLDVFDSPPPTEARILGPSALSTEPASDTAAYNRAVPLDLGDESSTIFVKGLAWSSTEKSLRRHFERACRDLGLDAAAAVRAARIATKPGSQGKKQLSRGFGFVECGSVEAAAALLRKLQGSALEGQRLQLSYSQQQQGDAAAAVGGQKKPEALPEGVSKIKLVVRNVAFEATRKDLLALFTPFGQVKSCRVPRKFDGNHR